MRHLRLSAALLACMGLTAVSTAEAGDGYVYVPNSYYVAPVVGAYYPVLYQAPVMVYQPAPAVAAPPVATYYPAPGPARVRETWNNHPWRSRYRYEVKYPGGVEYKYHYMRDGRYVRTTEKWDD